MILCVLTKCAAELEVLQGIDDDDWAKINCVAIEVHDVDGRLNDIKTLLMTRAITEIDVSQEDFFKGTNVWSIIAGRS
eukprot:112220-Prorocentrum_minimum.AAC.3